MLPAPRPSPLRAGIAFVTLLLGLAGAAPADAAFLGSPAPDTPYHTFRHGVDVDRTVRKVTSSRDATEGWTSPVTLRNVRIVARESYGLLQWKSLAVDVSGLFGISRGELDFGTVDMQDGGTFWDTYAPNTGQVGSRRALRFGDAFGSSWGGALRARLFKLGGFDLSGGAQLIYSNSTDTGLPAMRLHYNEWDFFLGTTWEQRFVSLYAGLDAAYLVGELQLPDRATDLDQERAMGAYGGLKMRFYRHLVFVTELRLVNQSSYSVQLTYVY